MKKENFFTFWLTGLSGAGKTTTSKAFKEEMSRVGMSACIIDGDELRSGLCSDLGFSAADRSENVRRAACMAKILNSNGVHAIVAMISPYSVDREAAYEIIGESRCIEVYLNTPLHVCEKRDPKGLYAKARTNSAAQMTGIQSPYECPEKPALVIDTSSADVSHSVNMLMNLFVNKFNHE